MDPLDTVSKNVAERTKEFGSSYVVLSSDGYPDKSINSLGALIEYAAKRYPGEAGFYYPMLSESNTTYGSITWEHFHHLTNVIAAEYSGMMYQALAEANETRTQPTVALFGRGNTVEYYITQMALQKLNIRTLLLGEITSPEALCSLVQRCSALALIIESGLSLHAQDLRQIPMIEDPFSRAQNPLQRQETLHFDDGQDPWERQVFILHSSGSTGPPKPIIHMNRSILTVSRRYRLFPDLLVRNWLLMVPLYAVTGSACVSPSGYAYNIPTTFPPRSLSLSNSPTSELVHTLSLFSSASSNEQRPQIDSTSTNPAHIVALYHHIRSTTNDFTPLRQFKLILLGGATLEKSVLEKLLKEGVNLKQGYGSTELGPLLRTYPNHISNSAIEKMRITWPEGSGLVMEPLGRGIGDEDKFSWDAIEEQRQGQEQEQSSNDAENLYELIAYPSFPAAAFLWGPPLTPAFPPRNPSAQTISYAKYHPRAAAITFWKEEGTTWL